MKSKHLAVPLLASLALATCVKQQNDTTFSDQQVEKAKTWFEQNVLTRSTPSNPNNYRATLSKTILWDHATIVNLAGVPAVVIPLKFSADVYLRSASSGPNIFELSDASRLVIYSDSANNMKYQQITFIPDSNMRSVDSGFSGTVLTEDWSGNTLVKPRWINKYTLSKKVDVVEQTQVCNTIYGYNYSADDMSQTYDWSETSCTTYGLPADPSGGGGPLSPPLLARTAPPIPLTITIPPPTSPIQNIADYFKCFTNGSSPDHTYSVQVCVDQPDPGTRQPWTLTPGGAAGTSAASNPLNVGHTFLVLTENDQGNIITRNVGFYPASSVFPLAGYTSSQGVLNDDDGHPYNISLTINVSATQFFGILNSVSLGNNPGFSYDLNTDNCTTFVINTLGNNGISLPNTIGTWATGSGNDPGDLGQDISQMQLAPNMTRNTVGSAHPNVGTCN